MSLRSSSARTGLARRSYRLKTVFESSPRRNVCNARRGTLKCLLPRCCCHRLFSQPVCTMVASPKTPSEQFCLRFCPCYMAWCCTESKFWCPTVARHLSLASTGPQEARGTLQQLRDAAFGMQSQKLGTCSIRSPEPLLTVALGMRLWTGCATSRGMPSRQRSLRAPCASSRTGLRAGAALATTHGLHCNPG